MPRIIKPVSKGDIAVPTIQVDSSGRIFSAKGRIILASPVMPCIMISVGMSQPHNVHERTRAPATLR